MVLVVAMHQRNILDTEFLGEFLNAQGVTKIIFMLNIRYPGL